MHEWERTGPVAAGRPMRWRLGSAARWGAAVGLIAEAIQLYGKQSVPPPLPPYEWDAVSMVCGGIGYAVLFVIFAAARNRFLLPKIYRRAATDPSLRPEGRGLFWLVKALLWPPVLNNGAPNTAGRLGRVLHWLGVGSAGLVSAVAAVSAINAPNAGFWLVPVFALALALLGRGLRYILAGE